MDNQAIVKVAIDAMGGDYAPAEVVKGAVHAVKEQSAVKAVAWSEQHPSDK